MGIFGEDKIFLVNQAGQTNSEADADQEQRAGQHDKPSLHPWPPIPPGHGLYFHIHFHENLFLITV